MREVAQVPEERDNQQWIEDLSSPGERRNQALRDLREILEGGLPYALSRWIGPKDSGYESFLQDVIQDTLMRTVDRFEQFRGQSKFTTWVYKIAIRNALTEIRRERWSDVSLEDVVGEEDDLDRTRLLTGEAVGPEGSAEQRELVRTIGRLIGDSLTERQRKALIAVAVKGMPTEEVARRMDTNRNALYKLIHDARLALKGALAQEGLTPEQIMSTFEE